MLHRHVILLIASAAVALVESEPAGTDHLENVRLRLVNGSSIRATIDAIDERGEITGSAMVSDIQLDQIVDLNTGKPIQAQPLNGTVHLRPEGQIPFSLVRIENERVQFKAGDNAWELALEAVRAIVWKDGPSIDAPIAEPSAGEDSVIVLTSGGARLVRGLIESVDRTHVNIFYDGESRKISLDKVQAIVPAVIDIAEPIGTQATINLVDGSTIAGAIRQYQDHGLRVALSGNHELNIPAELVATIVVDSDRIAWLSDLDPIRVEQQSQFAAARPWQRDRSLLGNPIRLKFNSDNRIHEFEKGIGTRSFTALVFSTAKKFSHFRSVVGIDIETDGHGDCEMVVEGDGIQLWAKQVRATDDPEPIVVDITDINEVALIVRPGENFDLADHANWADARFTKTD